MKEQNFNFYWSVGKQGHCMRIQYFFSIKLLLLFHCISFFFFYVIFTMANPVIYTARATLRYNFDIDWIYWYSFHFINLFFIFIVAWKYASRQSCDLYAKYFVLSSILTNRIFAKTEKASFLAIIVPLF